jgi:hypothetical protein
MDPAVRDAVRQQGKDRTRNWRWQDIDIATVVLYSTSWNNEQQKVYYVQVCLAGGGGTPRAPIIRLLIGWRVPNGMRDAGTARAWGGAGGREGQAVPSLLGSSDRVEERRKERHGQLTGS